MTLTAGVRYDRQQNYYTVGQRAPMLTSVFPTASRRRAGRSKSFNNIAPRIGVTIDPEGDGKTAVKAFYGRYYFNIAQSFARSIRAG